MGVDAMKLPIYLSLSLGALALATTASAAELASGLAVGDAVPAWNVVKSAGAADDGVECGSELCYR